ncbi:MAG: AMP-binding protein, partial [Anaerolineae bacterium]
MFFGDWLERREMLSPSKIALIDAVHRDRPITYRQWNRQTNQLANFLRNELDIRKGDRVSIYALNRVEYLDALFACNKLGAILHVINWRLKVRELEDIINDASPSVLIYSQEFTSQIDALRSRLSTVERFVGLDQVTSDRDVHWPTERDNWPATQPPAIELDWRDPWVICYTGGTTGLPKGAILHYRSVTANAVNTVVSWGLQPDDVTSLNAPLFHSGGLNVFTTPLVYLGGTSIVCPGFDLDQLFYQIENLGVTVFFAIPTMLLMMIQHPRWESL